MAKKYLSLEEAASLLGLSVDAVRRAREKGDLRGFQDRGSWKFREQDIDEFRRSQQADSSPDMPMLGDNGKIDLSSSDSDVRLMADPGDDDLGDLVNSGSDVRLSGDSGPKLEKKSAVPDSDSDVKLFSADILSSDSDSDVKLSAEPGRTDSDIRLAPPDSDLKLIPRSSTTKAGDDSGISLEVAGSGARLNSDDLLAEIDSGISLSADDSGISLESFDSKTNADDSGISLDAGDSGISLDLDLDAPSPAPADMSRTMPMQAIPGARKALADSGATTEFEVPAQVAGRESEFELAGLDDDDGVGTSTSVLTFDDDPADSKTIAAGTIAASADDEEVVDESYDDGEGYDEESYDEYDADAADGEGDEEGFEVGGTTVSGGPAVYARRADVDWGIAVKTMIGFSAIISVACAVVGVELIRTMWIWTQPDAAAPASAILDAIGSMF